MRGVRHGQRRLPDDRTRPPAPRWGWHRLDRTAARRIVEQAGISRGDLAVDLGAGSGVLTDALLAAGATVIAVELHPRRVAELRARYEKQPVRVVRADVTKLRLPTRPFHVVSNPPWSAAESVRASLHRSPWLVRADLVLPRWLVRRWAEEDMRVSVGCSVRAEQFTPAAPTGAAVAVVSGRRSAGPERVHWSR